MTVLSVCHSVCPPHAAAVLQRLKRSSSFLQPKYIMKRQRVNRVGAMNINEVEKIGDFRPVCRYIQEKVQDRDLVITEG